MNYKPFENMKASRAAKRWFILSIIVLFVALTILTLDASYKKSEPLYRSTSLREVITKNDNVERIDYVDDDGIVTVAAEKHYATCIRTNNYQSVLEEYFDAAGEPARQPSGYYAILREYNNQKQICRIVYLDFDKEPVTITDGYSLVLREYTQEGRLEKETFCDEKGNPVESKLYGCIRFRLYDEQGRNNEIRYLDAENNLIVTGLGYAVLHRTFYEDGLYKGKVDREFYFDANEQPIALLHGEFGIQKEYDEYGRGAVITYLDAKGNPITTKDGYTIVRRSFYPDDRIKTEMFFGMGGDSVSLSNGQYGVLKEDGNTTYLQVDGREIFSLASYLLSHSLAVVVIGLLLVMISLFNDRSINIVLLVAYIAFVVYITLFIHGEGDSEANTGFLWSYKRFLCSPAIRLEILYNVWLFIPLGTILCKLGGKVWSLVFHALLSIMIEVTQFVLVIGLAEADDVISNTIGALIGFGAGYIFKTGVAQRQME